MSCLSVLPLPRPPFLLLLPRPFFLPLLRPLFLLLLPRLFFLLLLRPLFLLLRPLFLLLLPQLFFLLLLPQLFFLLLLRLPFLLLLPRLFFLPLLRPPFLLPLLPRLFFLPQLPPLFSQLLCVLLPGGYEPVLFLSEDALHLLLSASRLLLRGLSVFLPISEEYHRSSSDHSPESHLHVLSLLLLQL